MTSTLRLLRLAPLLPALLSTACATAASVGPSKDLRLRHVVLYQNGIGYFERAGVLRDERLRLQFREHEIDDVLKSLVVVEEGADKAGKKPSTVSARLPEAKDRKEGEDGATWLDVVLSPRTGKSLSIAYAVPTAAWKATYRVILPDPARKERKGALLQAWALIDNVSDEDWSNVMLTLATGAPLSFASDIRSPRFVPRPDANGKMIEPVTTGAIYAEHATGQDRDADGIADVQDRCPDSPEDVDGIDDTDGCPEEDSDHDGIADGKDACPKEPGVASAVASRNGCPQNQRVIVSGSDVQILQKVLFEKGSDAIRPASQPIVDEIAKVLTQNSQIRAITIEGHAAADEKDVWGLAARRAGAVRAALIAKGVTIEIGVKAFGDTRPISDDKSEAGRAQGRRVEFHIEEGRSGELAFRGSGGGSPPSGAVTQSSVEKGQSASQAPRDIAGAVRYDITNPISIPRRTSTLVTIVNDYVPGSDVFLFRPDPVAPGTATHPLRAARLENTGFGFQAGSVAVFAGGTFVGEGLIDRLSPGETAMIPYALDSGTTVHVVPETTERPVRLISLARGVMTVENANIVTTRYEITVGKQAPSRMFLRHPRTPGHEAVDLPPGSESTPEAHLVAIPITPGKPSVLTIEERQPRRQEITILDAQGARLGLYLQGSTLPSEIGAQVKEIVSLRVDLGKIEEEMEGIRQQIADVGQRSGELRESLRAIEKTPRANPLQRQLMDRLADASSQLDRLSAKLAERSAAHAEARARLTEKLRDVKLEEKKP